MVIIGILNTLCFLLSLLGFRGIALLSQAMSILSFDILRIRRTLMLKNLDIVFGDTLTLKQKKRIARQSMVSFVSTTLEFLASKHLYPKAQVIFTNKHFPDGMQAQNKGMYGLCIHMSNWEYMCHINTKVLAPIHVVVKKIGKGTLSRYVENIRTKIGYVLIDRKGKTSAVSQMFRVLNKKEIIGFIVDQKRPRGEHVPFFGKLASTNNGLVKLYLRKKAPILPAIIKRKKPGVYEMVYFPEFKIEEDPNVSFEENVTKNTLRMNQLVEKMILENPSEYFWMHNRWNL